MTETNNPIAAKSPTPATEKRSSSGGCLRWILIILGIIILLLFRNCSYWRAIRPEAIECVNEICSKKMPEEKYTCVDLVDVFGARDAWKAKAILQKPDGSRAKVDLFIEVRDVAGDQQQIEVSMHTETLRKIK